MFLAYLSVVTVFLAVDVVWIKRVMRPVFAEDVPHLMARQPDLGVAAGFYLIYGAGIVYFAVQPALAAGSVATAAMNGAALGALAYGCYEGTNKATLKGWTWRIVGMDVAWGAFLTALSAAAGAMVALL